MKSKFKIDSKDRSILRALHVSPKAGPSEISEQTDIPLSTVRKRLAALKSEGVFTLDVRIHDQVFHYRAVISIDIDLHRIAHHENEAKDFPYEDLYGFVLFLREGMFEKVVAPELGKKVIVEGAELLLGGRADVFLFLAASDLLSIVDFVGHVLHRLPGVRATNTGFIFSSLELKESSDTSESDAVESNA